jgi:hypothetical protein
VSLASEVVEEEDVSTGFDEIKTLPDLNGFEFESFENEDGLKLLSTDDDVFDVVFVSPATVVRGITAKTRRKPDMTNPIFNFMMKTKIIK